MRSCTFVLSLSVLCRFFCFHAQQVFCEGIEYSLPFGKGSSEHAHIQAGKLDPASRNKISPGDALNCHGAYTAARFSLSATIFSIARRFRCLRELGSAETVARGIPGRILSVAESGSFRNCNEGSSDLLLAASPISSAPPGSVHRRQGSSTPTVFPLQKTNRNADHKQGLTRRHIGEREEKIALRTFKPSLYYAASPLEHFPYESDYRRLQHALLIPAAEAKNLTEKDMKLLHEADSQLRCMLADRSRLATALRKSIEEWQRLVAHKSRFNSKTEPSGRSFGRLRHLMQQAISTGLEMKINSLTAKISELERELELLRSTLRGILRQRRQRALSLLLVARRRLTGAAMTAKEANALSIANLIVKGHKRRNYVPSPAEGEEILKIGVELSEALEDAELRLSSLLGKATSDTSPRFEKINPVSIGLKEHLEKCAAVQKEAESYALQLRSLFNTFPVDKFKEVIKNVESGALQLRRKSERALQFLQGESC